MRSIGTLCDIDRRLPAASPGVPTARCAFRLDYFYRPDVPTAQFNYAGLKSTIYHYNETGIGQQQTVGLSPLFRISGKPGDVHQ